MAECLRDKITEIEYDMLTEYRAWYGWTEESYRAEKTKPIREVLSVWENANQDLYKLLDNSLILSKKVEFKKSHDELYGEMYQFIENHASFGRSERQGWRFVTNFTNWCREEFPIHKINFWHGPGLTDEQRAENERNIPIRNGLFDLISINTLVNNRFIGEFTVPLPDGRDLIIRDGCKPMKMLGKLAQIFNIPDFEDFRICHSLIHNQKELKGTLHLSIHPMDYWTMSDNECDWDSCMNWRDYGGYRHGTVEMMNSKIVVVAYLTAESDMKVCNKFTWNNKKWRQLFIVDKNVILGIKSYPYNNEELTETTMVWLKELAEKNLGWSYLSETPAQWTGGTLFENPNYPDDTPFKISFCSNYMYTDVGSLNYHLIFVGNELRGDEMSKPDYYNYPIWECNYSGEAQCISCGRLEPDLGDESFLCCGSCESVFRCSECGEIIHNENACYVGDYAMCQCCYDDHTTCCEVCEQVDFDDNMMYLRIIPKNVDPDLAKSLYIKYYGSQVLDHQPNEEYQVGFLGKEVRMCWECSRNFESYYLKPGCKKIGIRTRFGYCEGYYLEDLNAEGLYRIFGHSIDKYLNDKTLLQEMLEKYWCSDINWIRVEE